MAKKRSEAEHQKIAKAAIGSTRKTTIRRPAKLPRKEHVKRSMVSAVWLVMGVAMRIVVVASAILVIDWLVYSHSCDEQLSHLEGAEDSGIGIAAPCQRKSVFFME